jgi:putative DNA-invertase from lambdoid prophage Rac
MATYAYTRVSTARQSEEGESLDVQQRTVTGYAMQHGLTVDRTFIERGVSGSVPLCERPEGKALLACLRPGDVVMSPKLDRMFRSALDALGVLGKLQKENVSLHLIDLGGDVCGNGISKLVFTILSAVAEAERERIRERISTLKADQKKRNAFLGGSVPFGYRKVVIDPTAEKLKYRLESIETEQAALTAVKDMRRKDVPIRTIHKYLTEQGFNLSVSGVHKMLQSIISDILL